MEGEIILIQKKKQIVTNRFTHISNIEQKDDKLSHDKWNVFYGYISTYKYYFIVVLSTISTLFNISRGCAKV